MDANGKTVIKQNTTFKNIDVSQLENGLYFVKVLTNNVESISKLIIQH